MKVIRSLVVVGAMIASFAPRAEVSVDFHSDISPLLVGGDPVGYSFFAKSSYMLPDGNNQIVLRVSKLVEKLGEKEKFNSKAFVLTFDQTDQELFIEPNAKIVRAEQAQEFDEAPKFSVKNAQNEEIEFELAELPNLGGLTRDYEKELAKFNKKHHPSLAVASTASAVSTTEVGNTSTLELVSESSEPNMFEYWLKQASAEDIDQFAQIAFEGRKQASISIPEGESQALQMLGYWYNKASVEQRKQILSHLISL